MYKDSLPKYTNRYLRVQFAIGRDIICPIYSTLSQKQNDKHNLKNERSLSRALATICDLMLSIELPSYMKFFENVAWFFQMNYRWILLHNISNDSIVVFKGMAFTRAKEYHCRTLWLNWLDESTEWMNPDYNPLQTSFQVMKN